MKDAGVAKGVPAERHAGFEGRAVLHTLESRTEALCGSAQRTAPWNAICAPETTQDGVAAILREVMWAVCAYQPHTTEAGFTMLGRLPKNEVKLLMSLSHHKAEEAGHSGWARRDYLRLGGDVRRLEAPTSPATFAVAAVWQRMATVEEPFGYLGAEYLFERSTMRFTQDLIPILRPKGISTEQASFVIDHATEDEKHTELIKHWIVDVATRHEGVGEAMLRCFDQFAAVYPIPVWSEALDRTIRVP